MIGIFKRVLLISLCLLMGFSSLSCGRASSPSGEADGREEKDRAKWSICIYMVGSDLEDRGNDQLSAYTKALVEEQAKYEDESYRKMINDRVRAFTEEVISLGVDLPDALYNRSLYREEKEKPAPDPDAVGFATLNLNTILDCEIPEGVQFIIQTGGARRWESPYVNPNRSQRFLIDRDGLTELTNGPVVNMADPMTLQDFTVFCKENFPAEHEMMVFWDHGGGYTGFGSDAIFGTDMLTIREMAGVFGEIQRIYCPGEPLFDIIGFDACLMANLECAHLFSDYADYYFASAEEEAGEGWGYAGLIDALAENVGISPADLGKKVTEANIANVQYEGFYGFAPATFSVMDMKKVDAVYDAYHALIRSALRMSVEDIAGLAEISSVSCRTLAYGYGQADGYNLLDLGSFMRGLSGILPEESRLVLEALDACVIHKLGTSYFEESCGMSVYFPARTTGMFSLKRFLNYMLDISDNPDMDALYYYKMTGAMTPELLSYVDTLDCGEVEFIDYSVLGGIPYLDVDFNGDGNLSVKLPEEYDRLIQSSLFGLAYVYPDSGDILYLGEVPLTMTDGKGRYYTDLAMTWPSLGDNELPLEEISDDGVRRVCRVPILYDGFDYYLIFYYTYETGEYTVAGISESADNATGMADRNTVQLTEGDEFSVKYRHGRLDSVVEDEVYFDYVYGRDTVITDKPLSDGAFLTYIGFADLRSDTYYTVPVVLETGGGRITDQYIDPDIGTQEYGDR